MNDQQKLLELSKIRTQSEFEAFKDCQRRIQDVKAFAVILFTCLVLCSLVALFVTRW